MPARREPRVRGIRCRRDRASAPTNRTTRALAAEQRALAIARSLTARAASKHGHDQHGHHRDQCAHRSDRAARRGVKYSPLGVASHPLLAVCMRPGGGPRSARSHTPYAMSENQ